MKYVFTITMHTNYPLSLQNLLNQAIYANNQITKEKNAPEMIFRSNIDTGYRNGTVYAFMTAREGFL
jgi:hypothetical protein